MDDFNKYVGCTLEIIYLSDKGDITLRKVHLNAVKGQYVRVYCMKAKAPRSLKIGNILAIRPVRKQVV